MSGDPSHSAVLNFMVRCILIGGAAALLLSSGAFKGCRTGTQTAVD